jgi:hypothetical protein
MSRLKPGGNGLNAKGAVWADFKVEEARYDGIWEEAKEAAELMARHLEAQCLKSGKSFGVLGRILKDYEGVDLTEAQERRKYLIGG